MFYLTFWGGIESLQPYPFWTDALGTHVFFFLFSTDIICFAIPCGLFVPSLAIQGEAALHLSPPLGFHWGFILVGELQLNQMSFDPLTSLPRNTPSELLLESSPRC